MEKGIRTVGFMVLVSAIFIAVLATVNAMTKARIEQNFEIERAKSILYAFNIFPEGIKETDFSLTSPTAAIPWKQDQILQVQSQIKKVSLPIPEQLQDALKGSFLDGKTSIEIFERRNEKGELLAYGLPLYGKGLWGSIEGFGVISADLTRMVGIDFLKQSETPGLGARIMEKEYKYFFRNLDLSGFYKSDTGQTPIIMVKQKETTNVDASTNSVQAITGATLTSQGVLDMVNSNIALYLKIIQATKT